LLGPGVNFTTQRFDLCGGVILGSSRSHTSQSTMADDDFFFASAPSESLGDAPIVLGPPPDDMNAFAAPPADYTGGYDNADYVGEVNEEGAPETTLMTQSEDLAAEPVSTEPSPMQIWNDKWQETLLIRKDEETAAKALHMEEAKAALEVFQRERESKREAAMAKNREDEQAKLEAIEADLENDNSWQKVCKLVDLHAESDSATDVKRMRDVMILLKNEPTTAQALST
jgi:Clathrin light chain